MIPKTWIRALIFMLISHAMEVIASIPYKQACYSQNMIWSFSSHQADAWGQRIAVKWNVTNIGWGVLDHQREEYSMNMSTMRIKWQNICLVKTTRKITILGYKEIKMQPKKIQGDCDNRRLLSSWEREK